jgi:cytochrome d ubiquinol oxidase subunit I
VARHQPTKLAALEGLAATRREAPMGIAGAVRWKRDAAGDIVGLQENALRVPGMLSILVSGDFLHPLAASETVVPGLADLPSDAFLRSRHPGASDAELAKLRPSYWPNVPVVFQTYHLMIAIGVALLGIALLGCLLWATGRLWETRSRLLRVFLGVLVATPVLAQVATQCGWFTAEMGRQPWIVYQVLRTADAASAVVRAPQVVVSIALFVSIYALLGSLFAMLFARLVREGPAAAEVAEVGTEGWQTLSLKAQRHTRE